MSILNEAEMAAWGGFLRSHKVVIAKLDAELQESHGLPLVWYDALVQLHISGRPLRMKELADRLLLSRSATTRFVDRLEGANLVTRTLASEDRRGMTVELTVEGYKRLRLASPAHLLGVRRHFVSHLDETQIAALAGAWGNLLTEEDEQFSARRFD
jgi:DNA-binding MarR family transcriptional regulator